MTPRSDIELGRYGILALVALVVALSLLFGCAHPKVLGHSEMWKVCKAHCDEIGGLGPVLLETEDGRGCVCAKKPEAT